MVWALTSKKNQYCFYSRLIWRTLLPDLHCWKIHRRVTTGWKQGAVGLPHTSGASAFQMHFTWNELDSPNAEGETVSTVSRSESVLGRCTCSHALLKQQYLNFSLNALSEKIFDTWNILLKDNRTALKRSFSQAFFCSMHEQISVLWSAVLVPRCQRWRVTSAMVGSWCWLIALHWDFLCWKVLWNTPCTKSEVVERAAVSIVTVKM